MGEVTVRQGWRPTPQRCWRRRLRQSGGAADGVPMPHPGEFCFQGGAGMTGVMGEILEQLWSDRNAAEQGRRKVHPGLYPAGAAARDETSAGRADTHRLDGRTAVEVYRAGGGPAGGYRYLEWDERCSGAKQPGVLRPGRTRSITGGPLLEPERERQRNEGIVTDPHGGAGRRCAGAGHSGYGACSLRKKAMAYSGAGCGGGCRRGQRKNGGLLAIIWER